MMGRPHRCLAWLAAPLLSCALNPVSGRPELVLVSHEREIEMGLAEARKVEAGLGLAADPERRAWVVSVGARLAAHSPRQNLTYHFYVVDSARANAFALPGGHVYVSRGLLALVNTEDELANVLGHEIGHVAARHAVRRLTVSAPFAVITGIPALLTGIVSPTLGDALASAGQLTGGLVLAPYSRDQEREADRLGMELAARAGWDPAALASFLETLEREEQSTGTARQAGWLDTHPTTPERARVAAKRAGRLARDARAPDAGDRAALVAKLDGLLVGDDPSQGVFVESLFLHPGLDLALRFPRSWATDNARSYVAAVAPDGEAFVSLQLASEGDDPLAGALADGLDPGRVEALEELRVAGLPARRLEVEQRRAKLVVTWIARRGLVYRLTGAAHPRAWERHRAALLAVPESLRGIGAAERQEILEVRLRGRRARAGETLRDLVGRHDSGWTVTRTAVANALDAATPLADGQLVKLAIARVYRGGRGS